MSPLNMRDGTVMADGCCQWLHAKPSAYADVPSMRPSKIWLHFKEYGKCPAAFTFMLVDTQLQSSLQPTKTHSPGVVLCEGQWRGLGPTSVLTLLVIRLIAPTCASFANINKKTSHPGTVLHTWHPRVLIVVRIEVLRCWTGVKPFAQ